MSSVFALCHSIFNTKLSDLRKIICLRKSEVSVERISVCNDGAWHILSARSARLLHTIDIIHLLP